MPPGLANNLVQPSASENSGCSALPRGAEWGGLELGLWRQTWLDLHLFSYCCVAVGDLLRPSEPERISGKIKHIAYRSFSTKASRSVSRTTPASETRPGQAGKLEVPGSTQTSMRPVLGRHSVNCRDGKTKKRNGLSDFR